MSITFCDYTDEEYENATSEMLDNDENIRHFDIDQSKFYYLRTEIALLLDKEFGEIYGDKELLMRELWKNDYTYSDKLNAIIDSGRIDKKYDDVIDFLWASDTSGTMSYETCAKIYELMKDVDYSDKRFLKTSKSDDNDYAYLKAFLKRCADNKKDVMWF